MLFSLKILSSAEVGPRIRAPCAPSAPASLRGCLSVLPASACSNLFMPPSHDNESNLRGCSVLPASAHSNLLVTPSHDNEGNTLIQLKDAGVICKARGWARHVSRLQKNSASCQGVRRCEQRTCLLRVFVPDAGVRSHGSGGAINNSVCNLFIRVCWCLLLFCAKVG